MPIQCPKCPQQLIGETELYLHLLKTHRLDIEEAKQLANINGQGWRESQQATPDGMVAVDHRAAAIRAQMQKDPQPISIPMILPPTPKQEIKIPAGWTEGADRTYNFEKETFEKHTTDNIITKIARGKVTENHAILSEYTYDKDISELSEMQDKSALLEARMMGYTISDPEYVVCVNKAHDARHRIAQIKKDIKAKIYPELILEEYFKGERSTDGHIKWKENFMEKCIAEVVRLQAKNKTAEN